MGFDIEAFKRGHAAAYTYLAAMRHWNNHSDDIAELKKSDPGAYEALHLWAKADLRTKITEGS